MKRRLTRLSIMILAVGLVFAAGMFAQARLELLDGRSGKDQMAIPGGVDVGFAQSMIIHHNQALQMAHIMRNTSDDNIRALAESIYIKQTHEIGLMKGWLSAWGKPMILTGAPMKWVEEATNLKTIEDQLYADRCKSSGGKMEGLATQDEMEMLAKSRGEEQKALFLALMIKHHQAALPMAKFAFNNGKLGNTRQLTSNILRDQRLEISWMQSELDTLKAKAQPASLKNP